MRAKLTTARNTIAGVHYTTKHTAKMAKVVSLSTDINSNPVCIGRQKIAGSICSQCFAARMWDNNRGVYRSVNKAFADNTAILCGRLLTTDEIPVIDPKRFPLFEAFADLQNATQVLNYFKIARLNPGVRFALWTKNPGFVAKALTVSPKPDNLQIVLSSMRINHAANGDAFGFIDKVFTVYDPETIQRDGVAINCGARSCFTCRRCYDPNPDGVKVMQVSEKLK